MSHWQSAVALAALASCGDLVGLEPVPPTPLVQVHVRVTGDLAAVRDPEAPTGRLEVRLTWLFPLLGDASCLPPAESAEHAAVMAAGCRDPMMTVHSFDFTQGTAVEADGTATIDVFALPPYVVGDVYTQIAYASVMVHEVANNGFFGGTLYGGSFLSMAAPDTRVTFRHGGYDDQLTYYPRRGCEAPPEGFSLVSAGGFTVQEAVEAQARGELPPQRSGDCRVDTLDRVVEVALRPHAEVADADCFTGLAFYQPADGEIDPAMFQIACTSVPGDDAHTGKRQALVTPRDPRGGCKYLQHYTLRGCYDDPFCEVPDWNVPPPSWWPCPAGAVP